VDLATTCSHVWGSLHGNSAQPHGCSCAVLWHMTYWSRWC